MPQHDIVVIGGSAGGVEAIIQLARELPGSLPASIFVVLHVSTTGGSLLPAILNRESALRVEHPKDGTPIRPGHIYVAPPDHHLLLQADQVRVTRGPKHNLHRPAIDPLFRSAARHFKSRVIGVILTGFLDDGAAGLAMIKESGGTTIVQDPKDAAVSSMPLNALAMVKPDFCIPLPEIPNVLQSLISEGPSEGRGMPKKLKVQPRKQTSQFTCPDCNGTIWEVTEEVGVRFECRVGHSYSPDSMMEANQEALERSLWAGLRSLEESAALGRRLATNARNGRRSKAAKLYEERALTKEKHAERLRRLLIPPEKKANGGVQSVVNGQKQQAS